jgi:histidinol-phosphate aminotransferase
MPEITHLIRPDIASLDPYTPIVPPDVLAERLGLAPDAIIKLDANENPYGPAPGILDALIATDTCAIYPDPEHTRLRVALSRYTGQPVERIIGGAGADEVIDLLLRLFLLPGDRVIDCPPTFGMYSFDAAVCGGRVVTVPRRADFSLDIAAIERATHESGAKVLFVTSPNNPDGSTTPDADIKRLLDLPVLVVVDQAYVEFTDTPRGLSDWVGHYDNLVILRSFSKWAGLAGLRVGYALLPETLAAHLWKIKQPYNVNVAAENAAIVSVDEQLEYLRSNIARIVAERDRLRVALHDIPFLTVYPSQSNFLLCRVDGGGKNEGRDNALALKQQLQRQGILVRHYQNAWLRDYIRISIGKPDQNTRLLEALHRIVENNHIG